MQRQGTVDHTFVVRVWLEPHDDEPRARLIVVDGDDEMTARGVGEIERVLRSLIDRYVLAR